MAPTSDALDALRDVHLPEAVALWPLAPGWWLLLTLLLAAGVIGCAILRARRTSLSRAALRVVDSAELSYRNTGDLALLAVSLSAALRRVAVVRFGREQVAPLHGDNWLALLAQDAEGCAREVVKSLEKALYGPSGPDDSDPTQQAEAWIDFTRTWIRRVT